MKTRHVRAFTLLELLSVIAIIGILTALLFPGFSAARRSATKAKTKVQFAQWTAAVESFRSEYGHYPIFDAGGLVNGGVTETDHLFHDLLAARKRSGAAFATGDAALMQNRKAIAFHSFGDDELNEANLVCDAAGNASLAVLTDRDLDGVIKPGVDYTALPAVNGMTPSAVDIPATGVRAGVIFYAPAPGATTTNPEFVFSWK
jgi:prepilin-type N-terminal cleavage/methylation domain-containing protein